MCGQIPYVDAVKIALELKKVLTDRGMLEIQQSTLFSLSPSLSVTFCLLWDFFLTRAATMENQLFELMEKFGYGPLYKRRWKMMARYSSLILYLCLSLDLFLYQSCTCICV
jgi:hypothetical protein